MKSKKGSAMLGKFLFYFGNTLIGIIFVSPLIWMISASLFSIAWHCEKVIPYSAAGASGTASFKGKLITSEREPSSEACLVT